MEQKQESGVLHCVYKAVLGGVCVTRSIVTHLESHVYMHSVQVYRGSKGNDISMM